MLYVGSLHRDDSMKYHNIKATVWASKTEFVGIYQKNYHRMNVYYEIVLMFNKSQRRPCSNAPLHSIVLEYAYETLLQW